MTIAQTKAARRKFRSYYGKAIVGQPHYKRQSVAKMTRREQQKRELQAAMAARKGGGKKK